MTHWDVRRFRSKPSPASRLELVASGGRFTFESAVPQTPNDNKVVRREQAFNFRFHGGFRSRKKYSESNHKSLSSMCCFAKSTATVVSQSPRNFVDQKIKHTQGLTIKVIKWSNYSSANFKKHPFFHTTNRNRGSDEAPVGGLLHPVAKVPFVTGNLDTKL